MQIGEVAARTELSLRTIRHYEETGLVIPSARSQGGFRLYTETDVARLMVIRRMKPLGFTLEQMRDLLDATDRAPKPSASLRAAASARPTRSLPRPWPSQNVEDTDPGPAVRQRLQVVAAFACRHAVLRHLGPPDLHRGFEGR